MKKDIFVYEEWTEDVPMLMGMLYAEGMRGKEVFSFEYDPDWLKKGSPFLDPDLLFYAGRQYLPPEKQLFGLFSDSCPDRWGRQLMRRREAILAKKENRKPKVLLESDYLLGVYDESRMGALRFSLEKGGPFLSSDHELSTPPWIALRDLEHASIAYENDDQGLGEKWLRQLLAPGSSLGGARPKASVKAEDESLWIAKFPSRYDEFDSGAWEMVTHQLAYACGINIPKAKKERFSENGTTFLVKRFDRIKQKRLHFASAMALLGKTDGERDCSYLDLVSFIRSNGALPNQDLKELWKRLIFSISVSNTDDHLRNHGFLLTPKGWRLSPMYDVNPCPEGVGLSLNIDHSYNDLSIDLAMETADYYGLKKDEAIEIAEEIMKMVSQSWKEIARSMGIEKKSIDYMTSAFQVTKIS